MKRSFFKTSFAALGAGLRQALQWRLLLLWLIATALPTLVLSLPVGRVLADALDYSAQANQWAQRLDLVMVQDLGERVARQGAALGGAGTVAGVLLVFLFPLLNAMFAAAARSPRVLHFGELLHAGLSDYGPMLRLVLFALVPLGIALGLGAVASKAAHRYGEHAILSADADLVKGIAIGVGVLLFVLAHASIVAGRAWLTLLPRRRSAFVALWRGVKLVFFHPLRSLMLYLGITLPVLLLISVLGVLRVEIPSGSVAGSLLGVLVVQCIAVLAGWMHFARLLAMLSLVRQRAHVALR